MLKNCKLCQQSKTRIRSDRRPNGKYRYREANGSLWNGHVCRDCSVKVAEKNARNRGETSIDQCSYDRIKKGRDAERKVLEILKSIGFDAEITKAHGPDIRIKYLGQVITCEVKSVSFRKGSTFVSEVSPNRKNDDLIAYVYPDSSIEFESIKIHLSKCCPSGKRFFSERS